MANTVTMGRDGVMSIVPDGATDFDMATYFPNGVRVRTIRLDGSSDADVIKVRAKAVTGQFMFPAIHHEEEKHFDPGRRCFPYIKAADCTFTLASGALITFLLY